MSKCVMCQLFPAQAGERFCEFCVKTLRDWQAPIKKPGDDRDLGGKSSPGWNGVRSDRVVRDQELLDLVDLAVISVP